ncbi:hypothetical protein [Burkholderia gladioli]|uniref:hypothetical protein n=1 Tax=Burkholderia gladioli TaxID=28095 RepID=UPI0005C77108|nr:hypothetical protein [Burkholderia gladioli]
MSIKTAFKAWWNERVVYSPGYSIRRGEEILIMIGCVLVLAVGLPLAHLFMCWIGSDLGHMGTAKVVGGVAHAAIMSLL